MSRSTRNDGMTSAGDAHSARPPTFTEFLDRRKVVLAQVVITAVLSIALILDGLDIQMLALLAPVIIDEWGVDQAGFAPAMTAALIGMTIGSAVGGWLGDRLGRRQVVLGSMFAFGIMTIIASTVSDVTTMTLIRVASGLGFGAATPNAMALAAEWMPTRFRPHVATFMSIGTPLGGIIGTFAILGLLPLLGWRGCFVFGGVATLVCCAFAAWRLPESATFLARRGRIDLARASLTRVLGVKDPGISWTLAPEQSERSETIFTAYNLRLNIGLWLAFFSIAFVTYSISFWAPVYLTSAGLTLSHALQAVAFFNGAAICGAVVIAIPMRRFGSRPVMLALTLGSLCFVILQSYLLTSGAAAQPASRLLITIALAGIGGCAGSATAAVYAMLSISYAAACRSTGIGFGIMMGRLGSIIAVFSAGYLLNYTERGIGLFITMSIGAFAAMIGVMIVDRHIVGSRKNVTDRSNLVTD